MKKLMSIIGNFMIIMGFCGLFISSGCKSGDDSGTLQISLAEKVGIDELTFDEMRYTCEAGHTYSVITLKYYLTRLQLRSESGALHDLTNVIYRDARDSDTEALVVKDIPNGTYTHLEFIFGLDDVMNVDGGLENTLQNINMEWPIPGDQGYHYMKYEGKYDVYNTGAIASFNLHLGPTGGNHNFFHVTLPVNSMVIDGDKWMIMVNMDLHEWIHHPNTYDFEEFGAAIMMNQTAQERLKANGSTVFSVHAVQRLN